MRLLALLFLLLPSIAYAQITQVIRGQVTDAVSGRGLPGANVVLMDTALLLGAATDVDGNFKLDGVPIGRRSIRFTFLGYEEVRMENLIISPSKQTVLNVKMTESVQQLAEAVVVAEREKERPLNEMATVSARTFSVEETRRFAGSWQDPARAAAAFAGVSGGSDERNDIIIRGNAPTGLLWRLEGINIPTPNHLTFSGSTGGPVSILNNNMLDNSDFFTGAFPAEYGNANSGVFDLRLRRGNNEKREYWAQIGLNGAEAGLEGPFSKKYRGSYLASYRYSTMAIIGLMGIDFGIDAIPYYQDLTFVMDLPTGGKAGRFALWGVGGLSSIKVEGGNDFYASNYTRTNSIMSDMGVAGLSHQVFIGEKHNLKTTLAFSGSRYGSETRYTDDLGNDVLESRNRNYTLTGSLHSVLNTKFNAKSHLRTGIVADLSWIEMADSFLVATDSFAINLKVKEALQVLQAYTQFQHRFNPTVTLSVGLHYQQLLLNSSSFPIEPRAGLTIRPKGRHQVHIGAGLHSQTQPLVTYFHSRQYLPTDPVQTNRNMGFSRAAHAVVGHDLSFSDRMRLKTEAYFQYLFQIPVEQRPTHFSMLNAGESIGDLPIVDSLVNTGTGMNYGLDLTLEKFFSKRYYFIVAGSIYNSTYRGSDGMERNTTWNGNYNLKALGGYELPMGKKNTLSFDTRITWTGGRRYVPVDMDASRVQGDAVYDLSRAYEPRYKDYFRWDIKVSFAFNGKRASHSLALDFQNILNTKNIFSQYYDPATQAIETKYQLGFLPLAYYRVEFR
jgi:hypothetical protein